MTARWSGAVQSEAWCESAPSENGLEDEHWRVSHNARRVVSERDVFSGARDVKRRL